MGSIFRAYQSRRDPGDVLTDLGIERYCCRRMFVSHVDLIDDVAPFSVAEKFDFQP